ncbi:xanthine dehydrogenase family protein molybdopterin-binding subunit [Budviciaceae bacterium CWB-B4]|uniref:Xanthine dehydrogenase family protein molybdopterin-binding subunit n=1 Tax=Limnobaculum xujianqingii TaxID=2738837 RepID=A0A9D7FT36_9GAMM|nr:molybdopterin cofactor-binding domain-containing protein [Limnobaculum xujianqingii]MBK5072975.1 xanthine dehydrogenase family protein molybdopterin-binding subunit [Limnobaculum xujianqingii]MBK5176284.1 xanthine dehydrogenase family protein molybdopterin-binding subunit [Limnobaculum xujianqingii]
MALSRRQFLKSAAIVSLVIPLIPGANAALIYNSPEITPDDLPMNDWIWIGADNQIVIGVSQCEVGQGIYTGLATVLASEMDADWDKVKVKFVIGRDAYRQESGGEERSQFVAASTSMTNFYQRMRVAGAQARCFFIAAAAREWNVDAQQLRTENSFVIDDHRGKKIAYSDLIHWSQDIPLEANPALKTAEQEKGSLIGRNLPRIDCGEKVDGSAEFGIDVQVPDLHIGVPWMGPSLNGKLGSIRNEKQILSLPGVIALVRTRHWSTLNMARLDPDMAPNTIIVVAKTYWQAKKAADRLDVEWIFSDKDNFSSETINQDNKKALESDDFITATNIGDAQGIIDSGRNSARFHEARYKAPYITHATMEPCNGTCYVEKDRVTAWGPFQGQDLAQKLISIFAGVPIENVTLHNTLLGGSYGRKYIPDPAMHACLASKATGKPVKVIYPREVDIQHAYYRPGNTSHYQALLDEDGYPLALWARYAGQGLFWQLHRSRVTKNGGWDETIVECVYNTRYDLPALKVESITVEQNISLSFLRGVGSVASIFFLESFISELAIKANKDQLEYRMRLLKNEPEMQRVLKATADAAGWGNPLADNHYQGMAVNIWVARDEAFISYVALVAEIEVLGSAWKVTRMICGVECGKVINPGLIKANIEGGIGFALSGALHSQLHFEHGGVVESNYNNYGVLHLSEQPEIEVVILDSERDPQGCGEVSTAVVAPAIASALQVATGKTYTEIPFPAILER